MPTQDRPSTGGNRIVRRALLIFLILLGVEVEEPAATVVFGYFVVSPTPDNVQHISVVK